MSYIVIDTQGAGKALRALSPSPFPAPPPTKWMAVEAHQTHVDDIYANHGPITRVATIGGETTIHVGWNLSTTGGKTRRVVVGRVHTSLPPPPPTKTTAEVLAELRALLEADYASGRAARNTAATTGHLAYIDGECGGLHRALSYLREYE